MGNIFLLLLAITSSYFPLNPVIYAQQKLDSLAYISFIPPIKEPSVDTLLSRTELAALLSKKAPHLRQQVINKVVTSLKCAKELNVDHNNILTVIDYSLPSSEKRLWVFDLKKQKLLFYTYVSHGIKSGTLLTDFFSNINNSKASSLGVYKTEQAYYGRQGLSLRLDGLERKFNNNAFNRAIVMHGGWYVDEEFIKKYGRPGRSWGCPALPLSEYRSIIKTIKDDAFLVVYYPSENWFDKSKFLNCSQAAIAQKAIQTVVLPKHPDDEARGEVLLADVPKKYRSENSKAILAMRADNYQQTFHIKPPLKRMLRRRIDKMEYIALSKDEFDSLNTNSDPQADEQNNEKLNSVHLVIPVIKMNRGYYKTEMHILDLGKIQQVRLNADSANKLYTLYFEHKSAINLRPTDKFIRWLGL